MNWVHKHWSFPLNPSQTFGEKVVGCVQLTFFAVMCIPPVILVCCTAPIYYGTLYAIDCVHNCICDREHEKCMKTDWSYRLSHTAYRMSVLKIWQRDINAYDQHLRKILAISEINDLPLEVWNDLLSPMTDIPDIADAAKEFGTAAYTQDIKDRTVKIAIAHYTRLYATLHLIDTFTHAESLINDIIAQEMFRE